MINSIAKRHSRIRPYTDTELIIIRSAAKLFFQNGFTHTTFKMLEADCGVKVGNITYYFRSKEDLLTILIEELMEYHADVLDNMYEDVKNHLVAYAMEIAVQIVLCENNRSAWDLYYSAYSLPQTYEHIKMWAAEKNYNLFKERLPDWSEHDFRNIEIVASGIEFAALKTQCDRNLTLEKKISVVLDSMMKLYEVKKEERKAVIEKVLAMDYEEIAEDMFDSFVKRIDDDKQVV